MSDTNCLRIKKVKVLEGGSKIKMEYTEVHGEFQDEISATFLAKAAPEFYKAFTNLTNAVCMILELTKLDRVEERITPYGVTYHYSKDGTMGAIISAKLAQPEAGTEVVVNTPMRKCAPDDKSDEVRTYFTESTTKNLWKLETEARNYLSGKRAQTELFGTNNLPLDAQQIDANEIDEADELVAQQEEDITDAMIMPPEVAASNVTDISQYAAQR